MKRISDEEIDKVQRGFNNYTSYRKIAQAQLDSCEKETLAIVGVIFKEHKEKVREIFEEIEKEHTLGPNGDILILVQYWQVLKQKYGGES